MESKDFSSDEDGGFGDFRLLGFRSAIDHDGGETNASGVTFFDLPSCSTIEKGKSV